MCFTKVEASCIADVLAEPTMGRLLFHESVGMTACCCLLRNVDGRGGAPSHVHRHRNPPSRGARRGGRRGASSCKDVGEVHDDRGKDGQHRVVVNVVNAVNVAADAADAASLRFRWRAPPSHRSGRRLSLGCGASGRHLVHPLPLRCILRIKFGHAPLKDDWHARVCRVDEAVEAVGAKK